MDAGSRSPFGTLLRQFREAAALSQEQLAEHAGLSVRGVSDLERGLRLTPRLETVRMLADGLGLNEGQRAELIAARNLTSHIQTGAAVRKKPGLPVPTTSFIGRIAEIDSIIDILQNTHARLITLTGPGGVGKTRIAIEAAHRLASSFTDGSVFVDLSPVREPKMVIPAIADRLGIVGQGERDIRDILDVALQGRPMLIVLDNLEQVIEAATDIAWLLATCPDITIIATSRVLFRISAEHVMPIEPLSLPTYHDVYTFEQVDAVTLFVERARAADHQFFLDHENAPTVAAIVNRLQGMPLAIELAAAHIRLFPLQDLLNRLESQLPVLAGGVRDGPERHHTMRDTIAWSYNLLSPTGQAVFRTLSIFPDGCALETAAAVASVDNRFSEAEIVTSVELLVDSSMLRRREVSDGQARYWMLQTLQEYGLEQLAAEGEETVARRAAHDAWCIPLAREVELSIARPDAVFWLNRMSAEYPNVRAHLSWLVGNGYYKDALDISGSVAAFRAMRGDFDEGRMELAMLLARQENQAATVIRMRGLIGLGIICNQQAVIGEALPALEEGVRLARELGEQWHIARASLGLGVTMALTGELDKAEALVNESISLARALDDEYFVACALSNLSLVYDQRGDLERALVLITDSATMIRSFGNLWDVAFSDLNLGYIHLRRGELDLAEDLILEAKRLFIQLGDRRDLPAVYLYLADIARQRSDFVAAEYWLKEALGMSQQIGLLIDIANSYLGLAQVARLRGDLTTSRLFTCDAILWYERCGSDVEAVRCLTNFAEIAVATGDPQRAAWCIGAVDGVLAAHGMSRPVAEFAEHQALVERVKSLLVGLEWQFHYDRGRSMSTDDILAEVHSWQAHDVLQSGRD